MFQIGNRVVRKDSPYEICRGQVTETIESMLSDTACDAGGREFESARLTCGLFVDENDVDCIGRRIEEVAHY